MGNFVLLPGFSFMMTGRQNAKFKKWNILQRWYNCHKLLNIFMALLKITWIIHKILFASQRFMVIYHMNVFT